MKKRWMAGALLTLSLAGSAFGALSKENTDFAKGPTQYLLTKEEQKQWRSVATDEQAKAFIDLFWARRDPSPGTARNEFHDGILERIKHADESYATAQLRGSATDRGKVYIVMGASDRPEEGWSTGSDERPHHGRFVRPADGNERDRRAGDRSERDLAVRAEQEQASPRAAGGAGRVLRSVRVEHLEDGADHRHRLRGGLRSRGA